MVIKENFLREIREKYGIQLAELAKRVGVTRASLNGFEKKRHSISDEVLLKIANILNVRPEEIIPGKSIKNTEAGQKYLFKAIKMTDKYYAKQNFSEDFMIDIATELYNFLVDFDEKQNKNKIIVMKKDLKNLLCKGLAAKCFLDFLDKNKL
jgi:transcriptional regulator with XRE-family HTH domain